MSQPKALAGLRERVLTTVRKYPGLSLAELARQAHTSAQLAEYHLRVLAKNKLVIVAEEGRHKVFFPEGGGGHDPVDRRDRHLVATLRRPMALRIALQLLETDATPMGDLASACGISASTATHHVKRLERAEVVHIIQDGRTRLAQLADADRLQQVLREHPPPRDVVSGFIEMWDRLDA